MPLYCRAILCGAYLFIAGLTMYKGYQNVGPGWLLPGLPFAAIFGFLTQAAILRVLPPKLQQYAEGGTWLKLK
jgi:hypothetical protein